MVLFFFILQGHGDGAGAYPSYIFIFVGINYNIPLRPTIKALLSSGAFSHSTITDIMRQIILQMK